MAARLPECSERSVIGVIGVMDGDILLIELHLLGCAHYHHEAPYAVLAHALKAQFAERTTNAHSAELLT